MFQSGARLKMLQAASLRISTSALSIACWRAESLPRRRRSIRKF